MIQSIKKCPKIVALAAFVNLCFLFFIVFSDHFSKKMSEERTVRNIVKHSPHLTKYTTESNEYELILVADMDKVAKV